EERVTGDLEARRSRSAGVVIEPDVAVRPFGDQVMIAVAVHVDEAVPLADVDAAVLVAAPHVTRYRCTTGVLEVHDVVRAFLHEQVEIAITVNVDELRPRHVEAAQERMGEL